MWDDNLPLDELDPCCQKEIESERRKTSISKELRKTDRSNVRNDLVQTVFGNYGNNNGRCGCCSKPSVDYPLLAQLKKQQQQQLAVAEADEAGKFGSSSSSSGGINKDEDDDDTDDDDDEGLYAELLDTLTPFEEERLNEAKLAALRLEQAVAGGYGIHIEDSTGHIETMIDQGRAIVCHLYDPTSSVSAIMDCALEMLAKKYLGTSFRRVELTAQVQLFRAKRRLEDHGNIWQPCLAVFSGRQLTTSTCKMELFCEQRQRVTDGGDDGTVGETIATCARELEKFLDRARVLEVDLSYTSALSWQARLGENNDDDDEQVSSYCGLDGCGRNYPHEHITDQRGGTLSGAAAAERGADALAPDWHLKM